jgi:hypothetical protein
MPPSIDQNQGALRAQVPKVQQVEACCRLAAGIGGIN